MSGSVTQQQAGRAVVPSWGEAPVRAGSGSWGEPSGPARGSASSWGEPARGEGQTWAPSGPGAAQGGRWEQQQPPREQNSNFSHQPNLSRSVIAKMMRVRSLGASVFYVLFQTARFPLL